MKKILFVLLLLYVVFFGGCVFPGIEAPPRGEKFLQMQGELSFSEKPLLNIPIELSFSFWCVVDAPNTTARIQLPEGFEFVSGDLSWHGDLKANEKQKITAIVKSTKTGYYELYGLLQSIKEYGGLGGGAVIFVEISENNAFIGNRFKNNWLDSSALSIPQNNEQIKSELIISQNPELNKEFKMIYKISSLIDIPGEREIQINLNFPPNAFKVNDIKFPCEKYQNIYETQLSCLFDGLKKNEPVEISATFKVISEGEGYLGGSLSVQQNSITNFISDSKYVIMHVDKYGGKYTYKEL